MEQKSLSRQVVGEWLVEYTVESSKGYEHHLDIIEAIGVKEVQINLFSQLRNRYPSEARIEVTILMLEIVQNNAEIDLFNTQEDYIP
ncbi:MAG: hypothetical protein CMB56_002765 [Methanobacteriota archaeon]|nr:MAG: hypothetical protein CMB56_002765 [Euryarchaeota archaeon]